MKKHMSLVLILVLLCSMLSCIAVKAEETYSQSPLLDAKVESGELPPVEERLPVEPKLIHELSEAYLVPEIGNYGGTLQSTTVTVNFDAYVFVGLNESLLSMTDVSSSEVIGSILKDYSCNEDDTEFTFYLREGLKWSDGTPVTMEDFRFTIEDCLGNATLTPSFPNNYRAGGVSTGNPFEFEIIDDWTFKVKFDEPYGGFLTAISISGWVGYTDLLKPAHYLKPFHIDYAEEIHGSLDAYYAFIKPFAEIIGYDDPTAENVWMYVFNEIDMTNWEDTNPAAALTTVTFPGLVESNFPVLYPFVMESSAGGLISFVRNPYYFKVDEAGQQLPYIDYVVSTYCESNEIKNLKAMSGEATYAQTDMTEYAIMKENEENGGYIAHVCSLHQIPISLQINYNYGMLPDGSIIDDETAAAWQEVIVDERFREALEISIDAEEIIDTLYYGFATVNENYGCAYDIEGANDLLDEMGMIDVDGDGYRETPSGKKLQWQIWNSNQANDQVPMCEMLVEYWREIGLNVEVNTVDSTYASTAIAANDVPMYVIWCHANQLWSNADFGFDVCYPLWNAWYKNGGLTGALEGSTEYLEPTEENKELYKLISSLKTESPERAGGEVLDKIVEQVSEEGLLILPVFDVGVMMVCDADLGNIPSGGLSFAWNMNYEQIFFRSFSYED